MSLVFWNAGPAVLRRSDIAALSPLQLVLDPGVKLLRTIVSYTKDPANAVVVKDNGDNSVTVDFDFLDPGDGFVVAIVHDGKTAHRVALRGKVLGAKVEDYEQYRNRYTNKAMVLTRWVERIGDYLAKRLGPTAPSIAVVFALPFLVPYYLAMMPIFIVVGIFEAFSTASQPKELAELK